MKIAYLRHFRSLKCHVLYETRIEKGVFRVHWGVHQVSTIISSRDIIMAHFQPFLAKMANCSQSGPDTGHVTYFIFMSRSHIIIIWTQNEGTFNVHSNLHSSLDYRENLTPFLKKWLILWVFHQKTGGVSLIFSLNGCSDLKSIEKPYSAQSGHGGSIWNHTIKANFQKST